MKCSKCSQNIPEDSSYCPFCGNQILTISPFQSICMKCGAKITEHDAKYCWCCGQEILEGSNGHSDIKKKPITNSRKKKRNGKTIIIVLTFLCTVFCIILFSLFSQTRDLKKQYNDLLSQYTEQQDDLTEAISYVDKYLSIVYSLRARSTTDFSANEYIFTMIPGNTEEFQLTTSFSKPAMVTFDTFGDAAHLDFLDDSWGTHTNVKITADNEGISWFRFKNDIDDKEFNIIVIVYKSIIDSKIIEAMKNFSFRK